MAASALPAARSRVCARAGAVLQLGLSKVFSFFLTPESDAAGSELILGGYDER